MKNSKVTYHYPCPLVLGKAVDAYDASMLPAENDKGVIVFQNSIESRAQTLLLKILGDEYHRAKLLVNNSDEYPTFLYGGLELIFMPGATPDDDYFQLSFLSARPICPIRSFPGIGKAILNAMNMIDEHFTDHELEQVE